MPNFEDKRINEALELLNAVARDRKAELQAAVENKYTDLTSLVTALTDQVRSKATETIDAGKQKVTEVATDIDRSVHKNPWAYIGGTAFAALLFGYLWGRTKRD